MINIFRGRLPAGANTPRVSAEAALHGFLLSQE